MAEGGWRRGSGWVDQQKRQPGGGGGDWGSGGGGGGGGGAGFTRFSSKCERAPGPESWQHTVPSWEKKFCTSAGVPWKKLCETKKVMCCYKNIVDWDDSAGEEAFRNAKAHFWAEINGLPCDDISLPGPDAYIDEIDWYAEIDPHLLLDLDKNPPPPPSEQDGEEDGYLRMGWDKPIPCSGWGDDEDPATPMKVVPAATGWESCGVNVNNANRWVCNNGQGIGAWEDNSWENNRGDSSWDHWENRKNGVDCSETRRYDRKSGCGYGYRFPTSRYRADDSFQGNNNNNWRNCRGRRRTKQPAPTRQPLAPQRWNSVHSCAPGRVSAEPTGAWYWEKPVS